MPAVCTFVHVALIVQKILVAKWLQNIVASCYKKKRVTSFLSYAIDFSGPAMA